MLWADEAPDYDNNEQADSLAALVEQAFPALSLTNRRLDRSGGDHLLLMVDDHFAFRFPRRGMHGLDLELALLRRLQQVSPIATPDYQFVDPAGRFAGYPMIKGSALTPERFAVLSSADQHAVLATVGRFLAVLHGLPAELIAPTEHWPTISAPDDYTARGLVKHVSLISGQLPDQASRLNEFYNHYRDLISPRCVVIHGDLVAEHVLWDEQAEQLSGIIDFADVALGDPAQDLLGFWAYGAEAVRQLVELYAPAATDSGLLARSRSHFIRYRIGRLFDDLDSEVIDPRSIAAEIDTLLAI